MNLILKMRKLRNELSPSELVVVDYILNNQKEIKSYSIKELSEKSFSSQSSVFRMCKRFGFEGFKDFKIAFIEEVSRNKEIKNQNDIIFNNEINIVDNIIDKYISVIKETKELININDIKEVSKLIYNANKVIIFGKGASYLVSIDFEKKLRKININAKSIQDTHEALLETTFLDEKSILIFISNSGETKELLTVIESLNNKKINTISISKYGDNSLSNKCKYNIYTTTKENIVRSAALTSKISQITILDILFSQIAFINIDNSMDNIDKVNNLYKSSFKN